MARGIHGRLLLGSAIMLLVLLVPLGLVLAREARNDASEALDTRLYRELLAMTSGRAAIFEGPSPGAEFQELAAAVLDPADTVTIARAGSLVLSSGDNDGIHALSAPEVRQAFTGIIGRAVRPSPATGKPQLHLAGPVFQGDTVAGVVRLTTSRRPLEEAERAVLVPIAIGGGGAALMTLALILLVTTPLLASVRRLTAVAHQLAGGALSERAEIPNDPDTRNLAQAVNDMASSLERQVRDSYQERDTFGAVIHTMADALLVTDDTGKVTLMNPAACAIFDVSPSDAMGKSFMEIVRDHEIATVHGKALRLGRHQIGQVEHGRDLRVLRVTATPLEEHGKVSVLVIIQDLTDIQRLQVMRREFVANVSHEVRTPLAAIKASVEALAAGAISSPDLAKDFLSRIEVELDQLTEMAQRLLTLTKAETRQPPFSPKSLDLTKVGVAIVDRLQPQARQQSLSLAADFPVALPEVMAEESSVTEILLNLLANAIKYTPPSGSITLSATTGEGVVEISVKDTGEGIAMEQLPHIFERFYKADHSRSSEGVGLGLAIAKHLVQAQGGRIWADSTPDEGSVFHFTLPTAEQDGSSMSLP